MLFEIIMKLLMLVSVFMISILAHEFGHTIVINSKIKRRYEYIITKKHIGIKMDVKGIPKPDMLLMYAGGILLGLFPIWGYLMEFPVIWWAELNIIGLYLYGCRSDIYKIWDIIRGKA